MSINAPNQIGSNVYLHVVAGRTGKLLHAYGNVKASQGQLEESFKLHLRSLLQYKSTIGNHHHRTGDLCVKVSDHYTRLGQHDLAMYANLFFPPSVQSLWYDADG